MRNRRAFLRGLAGAAGASAALAAFPPSIRRALAVRPHRRTGTLADLEHVVILMQENRSFDHYFGTLRGVRGFGDRFPIPVINRPGIEQKSVFFQPAQPEPAGPSVITPFRLNTESDFATMRVEGTPHSWANAQAAWSEGRMDGWPLAKQNHSLGYFTAADIPFQFALAEAFTICDAYHCSFQGGTNPNRVFLWTGSNDPLQRGHGPVTYNDYDNLDHDPDGGYDWVTYCERLEQAGVSWQVYQDMADNFTDNPLAGFRSFRAAYRGLPGSQPALRERGLSTRDLDALAEDVLQGRLPQVSFIVATAEGSEHPGPSSPAQGAAYTARVLDALTASPEVWSKTALLLMFDENDGFFDHAPPPAAPSVLRWHEEPKRREFAGDSTVDTSGEYHEFLAPDDDDVEQALRHRPYGLGPRVPLYVISPWSKGGWVNSQVFDHTSVLRLLERRFGVLEPNISAWRRAVCGDLTSAFDFAEPDSGEFITLPDVSEPAARARALPGRTTPPTPRELEFPRQERGVRPSRALPYELHTHAFVRTKSVDLTFANSGSAGAVFHVYDRLHLDRVPRRYTVEPGRRLTDSWELTREEERYDLWVLGPNGFHRHFTGPRSAFGSAASPELRIRYDSFAGGLSVRLLNPTARGSTFVLTANAYFYPGPERIQVAANSEAEQRFWLRSSAHWYDFTATLAELPAYARRFAGRVETGADGFSDPALGGVALGSR